MKGHCVSKYLDLLGQVRDGLIEDLQSAAGHPQRLRILNCIYAVEHAIADAMVINADINEDDQVHH